MLNTMSNNTVYVNVRTVLVNASGVQTKNVAALCCMLSRPIAKKDPSKATYMGLQRILCLVSGYFI